MAVFWEVSGTNHQYHRVRCWILTSHFSWYWLLLVRGRRVVGGQRSRKGDMFVLIYAKIIFDSMSRIAR